MHTNQFVEQLAERVYERAKEDQEEIRVMISSCCKSYPKKNGKATISTEKFLKINEEIEEAVSLGFCTAKQDPETGIYTTAHLSAEQIEKLLSGRYVSDAEYKRTAIEVFKVFRSIQNGAFVANIPNRTKWWPMIRKHFSLDGGKKSESAFKEELYAFFHGCVQLKGMTGTRLRRMVSVDFFNGSKELENKERLLFWVFFAETDIYEEWKKAEKKDQIALREEMYRKLNILLNYQQVLVKGEGSIYFKNGDRLTLRGKGNAAIGLSETMVSDIRYVECTDILTVENLTTFHYAPFPEFSGLQVWSAGFINSLTEKFLRIAGHGKEKFLHCGDIDGYGFAIVKSNAERLGQTVVPYCMSEAIYDRYPTCRIELPDSHRKLLLSFLSDAFFDEKTQALFHRLLQDGMCLEQESLL